jgi:carboxymethylenebutenolidase
MLARWLRIMTLLTVMEARLDSVTVPDGTFDLPVWLPDGGRGPGILLIQEVWGVGPYIRQVAEDLAELGYVVGTPDLFWRIHRNWEAENDDEGLDRSLEIASQFDADQGVTDCAAALARLRALPEVTDDRVGAMGFCLGGSIGYLLASRSDPDALVSFYGAAVPDTADLMEGVSCPSLFVFGGSDPYIPRDQIAKVEQAAQGRGHIEVRVFEKAGHAFHNHLAPRFHDAKAAPVAWELAATFLKRHLLVP